MRKIAIFLTITFLLFLVSCTNNITAPVISVTDYQINWAQIKGINEYELLVKDITTNDSSLNLDDQRITVNTNTYNLQSLSENHKYEISVRSIQKSKHSVYSNVVIFEYFLPSEISYEFSFDSNSVDDFALYDESIPTVYYIKQNSELVSENNYYFKYGILFISNEYLQGFSEGVIFQLYSESGIINLSLNYILNEKPFLRSNNSITFAGEDILIVFELCGGEIIDIGGNDITENDYTLDNNILIIDANFIQNLFDENLERNSVILYYQLKKDDQVIIGHIFINRTE